MNNGNSCCQCTGRAILIFGLVIGFLLGGLIVRRMVHNFPGRGPRTARAEQRFQNMKEFREGLAKDNTGYGVVNKEAGIYRIPVDRALEIAAAEWQNPGAARELLTNRVAKAVPPPPPPPPEAKSKFE